MWLLARLHKIKDTFVFRPLELQDIFSPANLSFARGPHDLNRKAHSMLSETCSKRLTHVNDPPASPPKLYTFEGDLLLKLYLQYAAVANPIIQLGRLRPL